MALPILPPLQALLLTITLMSMGYGWLVASSHRTSPTFSRANLTGCGAIAPRPENTSPRHRSMAPFFVVQPYQSSCHRGSHGTTFSGANEGEGFGAMWEWCHDDVATLFSHDLKPWLEGTQRWSISVCKDIIFIIIVLFRFICGRRYWKTWCECNC